MNPMIRVIAAVISREDQFLVCQRPLGKRHGGLWEFPGGKCEAGESDFDAVLRELREELGVDTISIGVAEFTIRDEDSHFVIAFTPVQIRGEPKPIEHLSLQWGTPAELAALPLAPSDRKFVERLTLQP